MLKLPLRTDPELPGALIDADDEIVSVTRGETCCPTEYKARAEEIKVAVNHHDALVEALEESERQIQYLRAKFGETGSGNAVLARIKDVLAAVRGQK